jgi:hypothetical protein
MSQGHLEDIHTYIHTHMHACIYKYTYIRICIYIHNICAQNYKYICAHVAHIHMHTYMKMSAYENVELPMTILGKLTKQEKQKRTTKLLTMVL